MDSYEQEEEADFDCAIHYIHDDDINKCKTVYDLDAIFRSCGMPGLRAIDIPAETLHKQAAFAVPVMATIMRSWADDAFSLLKSFGKVGPELQSYPELAARNAEECVNPLFRFVGAINFQCGTQSHCCECWMHLQHPFDLGSSGHKAIAHVFRHFLLVANSDIELADANIWEELTFVYRVCLQLTLLLDRVAAAPFKDFADSTLAESPNDLVKAGF